VPTPRLKNPFRATFGVTPPLLVGRDELIEVFDQGLEDGPGADARTVLYTGARGVGKTVMLNAVQERAKERGWLVIAETAVPGFIDRIATDHLPRLLAIHDPDATRRRLSGITAPLNLGGASWSTTERHEPAPSLRSQLEVLADILAERETGILITLDEVHRKSLGEFEQFAATYQHLQRDGRDVAFAGAGLESAVSELLSDDVSTFLRRADRRELGAVGLEDVALAIREPVIGGGRQIDDGVCWSAAQATSGYPFLIQLVGKHVWEQHPADRLITAEDVQVGAAVARRRLGMLVHEPALRQCSATDKSFLIAMAQDSGPSAISAIQERMGVDSNYASQYRLRLIAAELVHDAGRGLLDFTLPYLREYLREHAASLVHTTSDGNGAPAAPS
jgi:hypothetical protein